MNFLDKGWECPKCGAVMSPTTSVCVNCRGYSATTTITAGNAVTVGNGTTTDQTKTVISAQEVRKMTPKEVKSNYNQIAYSMKFWE